MTHALIEVLSLSFVSEAMVSQVTVDVLQAVVPVKDQVAPTHAPHTLDNQVDHLMKVPKNQLVIEGTYFLPVPTLRGFTSTFLKWAKTSSQGAAL